MAVAAHRSRRSLNSSSFLLSVLTAIELIFSTASLAAALYPFIIVFVETPSSTRFLISFNNSLARIVTVVVPSPTSES